MAPSQRRRSFLMVGCQPVSVKVELLHRMGHQRGFVDGGVLTRGQEDGSVNPPLRLGPRGHRRADPPGPPTTK